MAAKQTKKLFILSTTRERVTHTHTHTHTLHDRIDGRARVCSYSLTKRFTDQRVRQFVGQPPPPYEFTARVSFLIQ